MTDLKARIREEITDHLGGLHEETWEWILNDTELIPGLVKLCEAEVDRRVKETLDDERANAS